MCLREGAGGMPKAATCRGPVDAKLTGDGPWVGRRCEGDGEVEPRKWPVQTMGLSAFVKHKLGEATVLLRQAWL